MLTWSKGKQRKITILLAVILVLSASFLTFDWTQYYFGIARLSDPEWLYTRLTKTLTSFLVFILAFSIGSDGFDPADTRRLRRCFLAIFAGDLLFLLDELSPVFDMFAVILFLTGHVLVIIRNARGLRRVLLSRGTASTLAVELISAALILIFTGLLYSFTLLGHVKGTPFQYIFPIYAVILDISLWTGWMALRAGYFPRQNALLITLGATFFFVGDYIVGFNLTLSPSLLRAMTLFMTWIFYTPAITLLALSGYRWAASDQTYQEVPLS